MRIQKDEAIGLLREEIAQIDKEIELALAQIASLRGALRDPRCQGEAYSALSERMSAIRVPAAQAHCAALEAIRGADEENIALLSGLPETAPGILDVDKCLMVADDLRQQNGRLLGACNGLFGQGGAEARLFGQYQKVIALNEDMIGSLLEKKEAADRYSADSRRVYEAAECAVSAMLGKAQASVESYIANGDPADTSWFGSAALAFEAALGKRYDRAMMGLSEENEGIIYLSSDYGSIFYSGRKWTITGRPAQGGLQGTLGDAMSPSFREVETLVFTHEQFNVWRFMATFGSGFSDATPKNQDEKGLLIYSKDSARTITAQGVGIQTLSSIGDAIDKYTFAFCFEENGLGEGRVSILERDAKYQGCYTFIGKDMVKGGLAARDAYIAVKGHDVPLLPHFLYDLVVKFDEA
ncbi:MAG: hypothetical protein LBG81_03550, partial [Coriobacteriaceae bacterium]|nr:hypothetical protein [Coriobacteriaceae bacterium]